MAVVRKSFGVRDDEWEPLELVGTAEVADMLGIRRAALADRRRSTRRGVRFPRPVAELRCGPIWLRSQIEEYARERARRSCL